MPDLFDITTPSNTLRLDERRQAEATYSIANLSGRLLTGRALIVPDKPEAAAWITIDGESERVFPIAGAQQYTVRLNVPKDAPPGSYTFRLDALDVSLPDETLVRGPSITFEVPQPEPEQRKFPVGILIILVLVALLIIGGIFALAGRQPEPTPTPSPTPTLADTATPTATVTPTFTPTATPFGGAPGEISYMAFEGGQPALFVMNSNGSGRQRITGLGTAVANFGFWLGHNAWSPTGDRIAFICNDETPPDLCILNLESGLIDQITAFTGLVPRLSWAPNGNFIAYDCQPPDRSLPTVCIVDVRNGTNRQLGIASGEHSQPDWSPDGRRIAFVMQNPDINASHIYLSDTNGGNLTQFTTAGANVSDSQPSWSPDGREIAYTSRRSGQMQINIINVDSGATRTVVTAPGSTIHNPTWSPDGRLLTYQSGCNFLGTGCTIVVSQTNGSGLQTLVSAGASGAWGAIWRRNAPLRLRPNLIATFALRDNILVDPGIRRVPGFEFRLPTVTP